MRWQEPIPASYSKRQERIPDAAFSRLMWASASHNVIYEGVPSLRSGRRDYFCPPDKEGI
jgi:hypothetical protein